MHNWLNSNIYIVMKTIGDSYIISSVIFIPVYQSNSGATFENVMCKLLICVFKNLHMKVHLGLNKL